MNARRTSVIIVCVLVYTVGCAKKQTPRKAPPEDAALYSWIEWSQANTKSSADESYRSLVALRQRLGCNYQFVEKGLRAGAWSMVRDLAMFEERYGIAYKASGEYENERGEKTSLLTLYLAGMAGETAFLERTAMADRDRAVVGTFAKAMLLWCRGQTSEVADLLQVSEGTSVVTVDPREENWRLYYHLGRGKAIAKRDAAAAWKEFRERVPVRWDLECDGIRLHLFKEGIRMSEAAGDKLAALDSAKMLKAYVMHPQKEKFHRYGKEVEGVVRQLEECQGK